MGTSVGDISIPVMSTTDRLGILSRQKLIKVGQSYAIDIRIQAWSIALQNEILHCP
jgi:hypothetical protein